MSKSKTERKNKINLNVVWPDTPLFTIKELWTLNPQFVNITLRVRLTKAIINGMAVEIGNKTGEQGRPQKVFAMTPVTKEILAEAKNKNIVTISNVETLVGRINLAKTPPITNILQSAVSVVA